MNSSTGHSPSADSDKSRDALIKMLVNLYGEQLAGQVLDMCRKTTYDVLDIVVRNGKLIEPGARDIFIKGIPYYIRMAMDSLEKVSDEHYRETLARLAGLHKE